ncbi:MAG: hypothetical protein QOH62_3247, partial [Solirubrobacteraceae bacterium]|nr:hypothetical protein [Solirubrobacteraceae bacterium]
EHAVLELPVALVRAHPASAMSKERTVLLRTTSFSVEAGEAAVGARPATAALDGGCCTNQPSLRFIDL